MHIEFYVEEYSAEVALRNILPRIVGDKITFGWHSHQGKPDLLGKLPGKLKGYKHWMPEDWKVVVLVDADSEDCRQLKADLQRMAKEAGLHVKSNKDEKFQVLNRLAVEELEAWFFGDVQAMTRAYPRVPKTLAQKAAYRNPDAIRGGTWESLERLLQNFGYFAGGLPKVAAARAISTHMLPERNSSKSFQVFCDGLREIVRSESSSKG